MRTTVSIRDDLYADSPSELMNRALDALVQRERLRGLFEWLDHGKTSFTLPKLRRMRRSRVARTR